MSCPLRAPMSRERNRPTAFPPSTIRRTRSPTTASSSCPTAPATFTSVTATRFYEVPATEDAQAREVTIHHRGYTNGRAALDWTYEHFLGPETVFVTGSSAGSIPSPVYARHFAENYPAARVTALGRRRRRLSQPDRQPAARILGHAGRALPLREHERHRQRELLVRNALHQGSQSTSGGDVRALRHGRRRRPAPVPADRRNERRRRPAAAARRERGGHRRGARRPGQLPELHRAGRTPHDHAEPCLLHLRNGRRPGAGLGGVTRRRRAGRRRSTAATAPGRPCRKPKSRRPAKRPGPDGQDGRPTLRCTPPETPRRP